MAYSVYVSKAFEDDLFDIVAYLESHASGGVVEGVLRAVDKAKAALAVHPFMHAISRKPSLSDRGYRECFVLSYVIVYRVEENKVLFLRLFHQAQLYERLVMEWG